MGSTTTSREKKVNTRFVAMAMGSLGLSLCLISAAPAAWAADNFTATTGAQKPAKAKKTQKSKQAKAPKPPSDKGSGENKAERDKRLWRECKGRPNAGACEGYAT